MPGRKLGRRIDRVLPFISLLLAAISDFRGRLGPSEGPTGDKM
ncbi:TPA_asm: hypothetical protein [ssRNA phage Esthiorhiza.1_5]|uniref:Uncharacterized protein n=2 Tax=Leviviricetes TaxID=2842243 RepID=A0A8S5L2M5_9VIRU|nr:hypothetical protein QIP97_gp3 [ssRNA phage Esthiorhiza.1_5]QDH88319.1 MAG: hypothetical protein H1RhizoLitter1343_000002 [Leviviridae sp.]DAD51905.1 TPA_asm: hypothetical protein [ssRNA phage Esthiorhiza.1_5]